jgi:uncharacterized protein
MLPRTPSDPHFGYVLAHGAGAGMRHHFLEAISEALFQRRVATFRYEFPYMEAGRSRPDSPPVAVARVREAVEHAAAEWPGLPLVAGGKSFGGRMTSTAQSESPLPGVRGLAFLGFPLHPPGRASVTRAEHLSAIQVPMLFLQGTRDEFAQLDLLQEVTGQLGARAELHLITEGDHSFKVPKRSGLTAEGVMAELADTIAAWGTRLRG